MTGSEVDLNESRNMEVDRQSNGFNHVQGKYGGLL